MVASLKAKELVVKHYEQVSGISANVISKMVQFFNTDSHWKTAKECALITVIEILSQYERGKFDYKILDEEESNYWRAVKAEIEIL